MYHLVPVAVRHVPLNLLYAYKVTGRNRKSIFDLSEPHAFDAQRVQCVGYEPSENFIKCFSMRKLWALLGYAS